MRMTSPLFQALFLTACLAYGSQAQGPASASQPAAAPQEALAAAPGPPPAGAEPAATPQEAPPPAVRAQYDWGYAGADGQGKGTLNVLLDPAKGRTVVELMGLGERLMLLEGDPSGYRLQIPRRKVDERAGSLAEVPLPFLPQVGSPAALYQLLASGDFKGVKVTSKDPEGRPVKLRYQGNDDRGKEVMVWLKRTRWEQEAPR